MICRKVAFLFVLFIICVQTASADRICLKFAINQKTGKPKLSRVVAPTACPKGFIEVADMASVQGLPGPQGLVGPQGPQGAPGVDGADGAMRIYGDGSDGDIQFNGTQNYSGQLLQFHDVTINQGAVLAVPSGTVIRCTGTFKNNGSIFIDKFAAGGAVIGPNAATVITRFRPAHPGGTRGAAANGQYSGTGGQVNGGLGGSVAGLFYNGLRIGPAGGGGGGASNGVGQDGGGTFTVLCKGSITNNGIISAEIPVAVSGGGGGGGGMLLLASKTSVSNAGAVLLKGGRGGPSSANNGAGGGGGGGIAYLVAPLTSNSGTVDLGGGLLGVTTVPVSGSSARYGGGGGGGSGGSGGMGNSVNPSPNNAQSGGGAGSQGAFFQLNTDPGQVY